jgi:predicted membrane-bound dolichyl-phosphate-mannose-protein mannosyltransferase
LPSIQVFDEVYYVPSALNLLTTNLPFVYPHTTLGTEIISVGISLLGDNPLGWRLMNITFGTIGIVAFYFLALRCFKSSKLALVSSIILGFNSLYFSLSSVATLDILYLVPAIIGLTLLLYSNKRLSLVMLSALFIALSFAVKINFLPLIPLAFLLKWKNVKVLFLWGATSVLSFVSILTLSELIWAQFDPSLFVDPITRLLVVIQSQSGSWAPITDYTDTLRPIPPLFWFFAGQPYKYPFDTILGYLAGTSYWSSVEIPIFTLSLFTIPYSIYHKHYTLLGCWAITYIPWLIFDIFFSHPVYYYYSLAMLPFIVLINVKALKSLRSQLPTLYLASVLLYFFVVQLPVMTLF